MMNSSNKCLTDGKNAKLGPLNKATALNPNAAEFVPSALKSTCGISKSSEVTRLEPQGSSKKAAFARSESNTSNNLDDEVHQYWHHQLPDDITPNFEVIGKEELHEPGRLTLSGLSIHDGVQQSKFSASMANHILDMQQDLSSLTSHKVNSNGKMRYPGSIYAKEQSSVAFMTLAANVWNKPFINGEQQGEGHHYDGDYNAGLMDDLIGDSMSLENSFNDPIDFLTAQFPGFAAQSLAEVYYENGCDLNLTIGVLTHLEVDSGFGQNLNSNSLDTPNLCPLDLPALLVADTRDGLSKYTGDVQRGSNTYRLPSGVSRGDIDFASTVRKLASQDSGHWRYETDGFADGAAGSSKSSQLLASSYNGNSKMIYGDKWHGLGTAQSSPVWLETREAVANICSESREKARDFASLQNTCFEQARLAYLTGDKTLAKELDLKGQLYNMQMKAAYEKAKETIYQKRNPLSPEIHGYSQAQDHLIDLHGLHATEAIHVLNHELRILRSTARATGQRLYIMIWVGTSNHTKGSQTPARLPLAVEQYLVEEGLRFTQPRPGLLCVVLY